MVGVGGAPEVPVGAGITVTSAGANPTSEAGGAEVSTQQLIEGGVLIDHVRGHLKSIKEAG